MDFDTANAIQAVETHLEEIKVALIDISAQTAYTYLIDTNREPASALFRIHNATGAVEQYSFQKRQWS